MRYTGHPLVDAGVAAITAHAGRERPEDLTPGDLEAWAATSLRLYASETAKLAMNQLFTKNFAYIHPSMKPPRRIEETSALLYAWRDGHPGTDRCAYCGQAALPDRVHRDRVPLLEGRERMNFGPGGVAGLLVCGSCRLALQALVLAAPVASSKVTVMETPDPRLRLEVYGRWVRTGLEYAERSLLTGEKLTVPLGPLATVVDTLAEVYAQAEDKAAERPDAPAARESVATPAVTVYAFSNSGQGPTVDVYRLPSPVVEWLRVSQSHRLRATWAMLVRRAHERHKDAWGRAVAALPLGVERFVRFQFMPLVRLFREDAVAVDSGPIRAYELAQRLLEGVVGVRGERIRAIEELAARLGEEISGHGEIRVYREMFQRNVRYYQEVRQLLLRANMRRIRRGDPPLMGLEDFVTVFDEGIDETPRVDWRLAWDLTLLAVAERLWAAGWFRAHADLVPQVDEEGGGDDLETDHMQGGSEAWRS